MPAADKSGFSLSLGLFFAWWYAGNTFYNVYNKAAIDASGGKNAGFGMTISTMQLGVCAIYALILWVIQINPIKMCGFSAPEKQPVPKVTMADLRAMVPVSFCSAAAHSASVFALGADPLFGQIVKAAEPVLAAVVNTVVYGKSPSLAKWACLPIIVGGVAFSTLKPTKTGGYSITFDQVALISGMLANAFAAFKGAENKKMMDAPGIKDRLGTVGNQFALTEVLAFIIALPVMFATEGASFSKFTALATTSKALQWNLVMSGLTFYLYNELATMTIKSTGAVTASVANTAKRVIVLIVMAMVAGTPLTYEQKLGASIAIGGVLVYSVIDDILKPAAKDKKKKR